MAQTTTLSQKTRHRIGVVGRPNICYCFVANLTDFPAVKEAEESISRRRHGHQLELLVNTLNDIMENK